MCNENFAGIQSFFSCEEKNFLSYQNFFPLDHRPNNDYLLVVTFIFFPCILVTGINLAEDNVFSKVNMGLQEMGRGVPTAGAISPPPSCCTLG